MSNTSCVYAEFSIHGLLCVSSKALRKWLHKVAGFTLMYNKTNLVLKTQSWYCLCVLLSVDWLGVPLHVLGCQEFKGEAYQLQIEMERLNHQAGLLLKKVTEEADRSAIQEPMSELKMLWDNLDEKIISRQVSERKKQKGSFTPKVQAI